MLNVIEYGTTTQAPPLLIAHGLYGSGRNWGMIAKRLSAERRVITPDLRNHGQSPHMQSHTYADMAADLAQVIETQGAPVDLCGHSMGGKAAMVLALTRPELIRKLIVADIAPVAYTHSQQGMIDAMQQVDLSQVTRRSDAAAQLADAGIEPALQSFFTQSLDIAGQRWLLNLETLSAAMADIIGWPAGLEGPFEGQTLFLSGGASDYVTADHRPTIRALFPKARFAKLPGAGHWLHAEQPRQFEASVRAFLDA